MKVGVIFPQTEIGTDPIAVRDYAQAAEALGYDHLLAFDHVIGANTASRPGWSGAYGHTDQFLEPFALFGYMAAITQKIELATGIIILPQRQTILVAKQAATVDVLSAGRLRLGIGIGWNQVEYEALGENFGDRGKRSEEQIEVMRALWTQELVTFDGRWHKITDAGLNPMPVQRPIPVWFGGNSDQVLDRIARIGDGWITTLRADERGRGAVEKLRQLAHEHGRDPAEIGIESWVQLRNRTPEECLEDIATWEELGVTHVSVGTMNAGFASPDDHIKAITALKEAMP